jgi:repressor LexA
LSERLFVACWGTGGGRHSSDPTRTISDRLGRKEGATVVEALSDKRQEILVYITECLGDRGYPPSVREIGEAVGLASSSTVHAHLAVLQREGYLKKDPTKPRAITVQFDPASKAALPTGRVRHVPLVGDVAAGTGVLATENVTELLAVPEELTGKGPMFALRIRGDSMIDAGILDGDLVVVREQPDAEIGDVVVAGIPGDEATVKKFGRRGDAIVLSPANERFEPMELDSGDVTVYGKVVSVMRRL